MDDEKLNLIYIASIGRSGTTLFESILGAHSKIETSGEVHLWPHEILEEGVAPTGSGDFVQNCPFWQEMRHRIQPLRQPKPRIHFFREAHDAGRTLRTGRLKEFGPRALSDDVANQIQTYGKNNHQVFSAFLDLVEKKIGRRPNWVVDASKDPYRLLWLLRSNLFNIKVFHMVKDPRGFAFSVTKPWIREGNNLMRLYKTARQSLAWVIRNHLYNKISEYHVADDDYMLIQYEHLAKTPKEVFEKACNIIGCEYQPEAVDQFRKGGPFAIAGNPMRQENRPIELDERWKYHLPYTSRVLTRAVTSINRGNFGYS